MKIPAFTLIELLVVMVIIGILSTISVATFTSYKEKARLAKAIASNKQTLTKILAQNMAQGDKPVAYHYWCWKNVY